MNLILKNLKRIKLKLYKFITFIDAGVAITYCLFIILIYYSLNNLTLWLRYLICFGLLILGFILIIEVQYRRKGYQWLWIFFKYLFSNKKYQTKTKYDPKLLLPYKKIKDNYITLTNKKDKNEVILGIKLQGFNINLLEANEQQKRIDILAQAFRIFDYQCSLVKLENNLNLNEHQNNLQKYQTKIKNLYKQKIISKKEHDSRIKQLLNYYEINKTLATLPEIIEQNWYLLIYGNDNENLINQANVFINQIAVANINGEILSGQNLVQVLYNIYFPKIKLESTIIEKHQDKLSTLFNLEAVKFNKNNIEINKQLVNIHNIFEYPLVVTNRWLHSLASLQNTSLVFNLRQISKNKQRKVLEDSRGILETNLLGFNKKIVQKETLISIEQINTLMDAVAAQTEQLIDTNLLVISYANDYNQLKKTNFELKTLCRTMDFKLDNLKYQQFEGLSAVIPKRIDPLFNSNGVEMPISSLAASYPFIANSLNDPTGLFLGFNNYNIPVFYDQKVRNKERKNSNQLIIGTTGSGKSFTIKKELNWQIATGNKVIIIDPEREYKQLAQYHYGQWIDVGKSTQGLINPLQIFNNLDDENENPLVAHMHFLEEFLNIACDGLNRDEKVNLMKLLTKLYHKFNISARTNFSLIKAEQWPTLSQLYDLVREEYENSENIILKDLVNILSRFTSDGIDAKLWNGYSTIKSNNLLTVFDLYTLTESGNKRIINAQMFLILKYIEAEVRRNKNWNEVNTNKENKWVVITIDEAHLLIDKKYPAALYFMFSMVKRIRKYNGMMNIITQNINDFVGDDEIKRETTAIINGVQYLKCLQLSPYDLTALQQLYCSYGGISEIESNSISRFNVGELLFSLGGHYRIEMEIEVSAIEEKAILYNGETTKKH